MSFKVHFEFGNQKTPLPLVDPVVWDQLRPRWSQVHGSSVARVESAAQDCGKVDALWTTLPDQPIAVVTADCVPILLAHEKGAVAAIHAGWKGTYARILERFFESLPREFQEASKWKAWLGPSIRSCCYEVSEELIQQFDLEFKSEVPRIDLEPSYRKLDLIAIHSAILKKLKVQKVEIHSDCTFCALDEMGQHRYLSYRRGDRLSRQYSVIRQSSVIT